MSPRFIALLLVLCSASSVFAHNYTISPSSGPASGGTEVTITGEFGAWPYGVYFGSIAALETRRVDEHTLVAITPPHLPGVSDVGIFEYDIFLGTELTFTFEGEVPEEKFERILLPVFTPPVRGAFGSEFHSRFRAVTTNGAFGQWVEVFGLQETCILTCPGPPTEAQLRDRGYTFGAADRGTFDPNGNPGRFLFVNQEHAGFLSANLRVFDVSRAGLNFGTQMPVVRESDFGPGRIAITGVPGDTRFRNTLRIYATKPVTVRVLVNGFENRTVSLPAGATIFDPAYAQIGDLPSGGEDMTIRIEETGPTDGPPTPIWAFVTVTNNETQFITTISPMP